jgi:two-component system cell cycle sensor histidine kinase/response regulator CckA
MFLSSTFELLSFGHVSPGTLRGIFCLAGLFAVERRGRSEQLDRRRQIEITTLLESMPEAVFLFDNAGRVLEANLSAEELTGFSVQELRTMDAPALITALNAQDENLVSVTWSTSLVRRALADATIRQTRRVYHDRNGRELEALVSASPVKNATTGAIIGAILMIRDITELAQLQRRLADTQRHNAIGQMAAGIAHDFNNVLDTINQAVLLLEMNASKPDEERRIYSDLIKRAVQRGAEISAHFREYLLTGTGERSDVDLRALLDDAVEMTRPMWQLDHKVQVRTHFGPVPSVSANPADMRRVFTNLIINALEAMPDGGLLMIGCESAEDMVRVTIEDTGHGIPPEQQKNMFMPYFTTKKSGTGLGLSGAQKIVTSIGGNIRYRTRPGKGTCFTIELPRSSSRARNSPGAAHRPKRRTKADEEAESGDTAIQTAA